MSELYDAIPPERRRLYLQNAQEVAGMVAETVAIELGDLAVREAQQLAVQDAQGQNLRGEASAYLQENDLSKKFMEEMEKPRESGIADEAQKFLDFRTAFEEAAKNRPNLKYPDIRKFTTVEGAGKADSGVEVNNS